MGNQASQGNEQRLRRQRGGAPGKGNLRHNPNGLPLRFGRSKAGIHGDLLGSFFINSRMEPPAASKLIAKKDAERLARSQTKVDVVVVSKLTVELFNGATGDRRVKLNIPDDAAGSFATATAFNARTQLGTLIAVGLDCGAVLLYDCMKMQCIKTIGFNKFDNDGSRGADDSPLAADVELGAVSVSSSSTLSSSSNLPERHESADEDDFLGGDEGTEGKGTAESAGLARRSFDGPLGGSRTVTSLLFATSNTIVIGRADGSVTACRLNAGGEYVSFAAPDGKRGAPPVAMAIRAANSLRGARSCKGELLVARRDGSIDIYSSSHLLASASQSLPAAKTAGSAGAAPKRSNTGFTGAADDVSVSPQLTLAGTPCPVSMHVLRLRKGGNVSSSTAFGPFVECILVTHDHTQADGFFDVENFVSSRAFVGSNLCTLWNTQTWQPAIMDFSGEMSRLGMSDARSICTGFDPVRCVLFTGLTNGSFVVRKFCLDRKSGGLSVSLIKYGSAATIPTSISDSTRQKVRDAAKRGGKSKANKRKILDAAEYPGCIVSVYYDTASDALLTGDMGGVARVAMNVTGIPFPKKVPAAAGMKVATSSSAAAAAGEGAAAAAAAAAAGEGLGAAGASGAVAGLGAGAGLDTVSL